MKLKRSRDPHWFAVHYTGFIFIGLIKVGDEPYVIEYNVRMGDPETEVVLPRINTDLVELLQAAATQELKDTELEVNPDTAATVMLVSGGYPEAYEKGKVITGIDEVKESIVFHAGTKMSKDELQTNGGRVIALTSFGENFDAALKKSYQSAQILHFDKMYYRKDLGKDLN